MNENQIKIELDLIYEKIKSSSKSDQNGVFWETMAYSGKTKEYNYHITESIYSGNAGILLFLIEYYNTNRNEETKELIVASSSWIKNYCKLNETKNYGFYTGRAGVSYVFLRLSIVMNEIVHFETGKEILAPFFDTLVNDTQVPNFDLLTGISGTLLVLLHQYNYRPETSVFRQISILTNILVRNFKFSKSQGINWGRSRNSKHSLCGLSHGAAGISFVLYELGYYFSNKYIISLAKQAYLYEKSHYNKKKKNWPDFRSGIVDELDSDIDKKIKIQTIKDQAANQVFFSAWCHGAPGIGLTRLRMYELTGDACFLKELKAAVSNTIAVGKSNIFSNYSLCHGIGGNSFLLRQVNNAIPSATLKQILKKNVESAITQKKQYGRYFSSLNKKTDLEDNTLFNGYVGVGYFILFSLNPKEQNLDILLPLLPMVSKANKDLLSNVNILEIIYKNIYPITLLTIQILDPHLYNLIISDSVDLADKRLKSVLTLKLKNHLNGSIYSEILKDAFNYERIKMRFDHSSHGDSDIYLENYINKIGSNIYKDGYFQMNPNCQIILTKWPWNSIFQNGKKIQQDFFTIKKNKYATLINRVPGGIEEFFLTDLSYLILNCLNSPKSLIQITNDIEKRVAIDGVSDILKTQIDLLIKANFIIII